MLLKLPIWLGEAALLGFILSWLVHPGVPRWVVLCYGSSLTVSWPVSSMVFSPISSITLRCTGR